MTSRRSDGRGRQHRLRFAFVAARLLIQCSTILARARQYSSPCPTQIMLLCTHCPALGWWGCFLCKHRTPSNDGANAFTRRLPNRFIVLQRRATSQPTGCLPRHYCLIRWTAISANSGVPQLSYNTGADDRALSVCLSPLLNWRLAVFLPGTSWASFLEQSVTDRP